MFTGGFGVALQPASTDIKRQKTLLVCKGGGLCQNQYVTEADSPTGYSISAEAFDTRYRLVCSPALLRAEERATGTRYGASSFTTLEQADRLAFILHLAPGMSLLDVGAGAGWPGVYLAESTGCFVISTDLSVQGPQMSSQWMGRSGVSGVSLTASGTDLPFQDNSIDSVTCSDVFC
jgi:2-polyprenyl-3-methyl-5-hydroxy-6-metoxy-1,4-benzoquinol methylase